MKAKEIYGKIEIGIVTIIGVAFILGLLIMSKDAEDHGSYLFTKYNVQYNFYKHFFLPSLAQVLIYYCGFLSINKLLQDSKNNWIKAGSVLGLYLIIATLISVTCTYIDAWVFGKYDYLFRYIKVFTNGFSTVAIVFILFIVYYFLKEQIFKFAHERKRIPIRWNRFFNVFLFVASWVAILIVFGANDAPGGIAVFGVGVPYVAILVWIHLRYLLPFAGRKPYKNKAYLIRVLLITFLLSVLAAVICMGILGINDFAPPFCMFFFLTLFVVLPLILYISRNRSEKEVLQTALGSSQANLSFLRSQINPHFLFNALNTLYGTALQEHAERTSEGIQKLGDMMRFMLHENVQDKISLAREVEYLNNYIDLQKLRTATSTNIVIQTSIEEQLNRLDISPMLLIPFVENAFKHGISLQQASFINISLHTKENVLYFDVNNSVHLKKEYDPEKKKSGIGLQNVKQRLALLYPKKHELIIRESAKEFFVHLTIQL